MRFNIEVKDNLNPIQVAKEIQDKWFAINLKSIDKIPLEEIEMLGYTVFELYSSLINLRKE